VLQFNCGINRSGLELNLAEYSREFVTKEENALDLLLVMAHLGCQCVPGSVLYEKYTLRELERFNYVASLFPGVRKSLAETRCTLYIPESRYDCTRIGIGLFSAAVSGFGIETVFNIVSNTYFDADSGKVYLKFGKANGLAEEYGEKGYVYVDGNKISVKKLEEARLLLDTENRNFVGRRALLAGHFAGDRIEGCEFASMNGTIPEELMATIFTLDRRKNGVHANVSADKYASVPVFGESMADNRAEFDSDGNLCKLFSSVAEKRIVQEGGYCSYSAEESVEAGDCLITIPIGYSSGFSRKLSGRKISMQIETGNGSTVPCELCGRVCMDQICARVARENFGLVTLAARVLLVDSSRNIGSQELLEMLNHGLLREMKNF
jgi:alanine racemase